MNQGGLDYLAIAQTENIDLLRMFYSSVHYKKMNASPGKQFKIPLISHHIWFPKPATPSEMRMQDLLNLNNAMSIIGQDGDEWQHFLWTNCKACISESLKQLESSNIVVREIGEIKDQLVSHDIILDLIDQKQFFILI